MKAQQLIENIVADIIREIEAGVLPWNKPWNSNSGLNLSGFALPLRSTGEAYRGINILSLWIAASENNFRGRYWMTFNQAKALGGMVKKGSKASGIIYADKTTKEEQNDAGETVEKTYAFLKAYAVFNADQIEGLPDKFYLKNPALAEPTDNQAEQPEAVEIPGKAWLDTIPATVRNGGDRAYFSPHHDFIQMPAVQDFKSGQAYTSTLCHELIHWTGHKNRLNRLEHKRWGDNNYAFEELVAELGAAFKCSELGLVPAIREDHAPYLAHWLKQLKADPKSLMSAAAKASQAIDHLNSYDSNNS